MEKYKVTAAGYYPGERFPAIIMECAVYWAHDKRQVQQDFKRRMKEYDICIDRVKVSVRP